MRIAVLRALQLGDMLCSVPALRALRAAHPNAEIHLVGLPWALDFAMRFDRYVDGFLEFPGWPGLPEVQPRVGELPSFLERAQRLRFDLVVQLHGSGSVVNELAVLLGARRTAGFFEPGGYRPDPELFMPYQDAGHEIRRLLALMEFLGFPPRGEDLEFPLVPEDELELDGLGIDVEPDGFACVHPGARFANRRWEAAHFAAVADGLAERGFTVVLTGSAAEAGLVGAVADAMEAPALDLAGRTSLGALAALVARTRIVVCNDTGISHLAAALGVPSVVVVTTSDPDRWAPLDEQLHRVVVRPAGPADVVAQVDEQLRKEANPAGLHLAHPR